MDRPSLSNTPSSDMTSGSGFPAGFVWGAASASYQIEGAAREHGRGDSVWDVFCRQPGLVVNGHTGERSCDHVHRHVEDVALMREMKLQAYRFSIAWPRVMPQGRGEVSQAGLGFYDRLVDELLAAGITPWATLFHWDFPQALFHLGGWLNRDSASWFADFAAVVVDRLSDRVRHWITINEPQIYIGLGHYDTKHAPGIKYPFSQALLASHHTLLAHGRAAGHSRPCQDQAERGLGSGGQGRRAGHGKQGRHRRGTSVDDEGHGASVLQQHVVRRRGGLRTIPRGRPEGVRNRRADAAGRRHGDDTV